MANRITGIVSGFDTESIVKELMSLERTRVDNVKAKQKLAEWKQSDYRNVNTKLLALRTTVSDLKYQSTFKTKTVSSNDSDILTATATSLVANGNYSINVRSLASGVYKGSSESLNSVKDAENLAEQFNMSGTVTFSLTGFDGEEAVSQDFSFDTSEATITDVVNAINEADIGITATYDKTSDRFFLSTEGTGSSYRIQATADEEGFLTGTLKMSLTVGEELAASDKGVDAVIDFNGVTDLTYSTNTVTLNGITMNLKDTGETKITVSTDTSAIKEKIKAFVAAYNEAMDLMYNELNEDRNRDYAPLTDDEKAEMTEDEIKLWEERASSGMLRGDTLLRQTCSRLRSMAMGLVGNLDGDYNSLSSIGINTKAYDYNDNGKLYITDEDLDKALAADPEGVMNLFTQASEESGNEGIAMRLYDSITEGMDSIYEVAGSAEDSVDNSTLGEQISDYEDKISDLTDYLNDLEERYYAQFTAMETALSNLSSQASLVSSLLGTSSSSS